MKNKQIFKEGDRVFDIVNGWGKIIYTYNVDDERLKSVDLICAVRFENGEETHYSKIQHLNFFHLQNMELMIDFLRKDLSIMKSV